MERIMSVIKKYGQDGNSTQFFIQTCHGWWTQNGKHSWKVGSSRRMTNLSHCTMNM